MSIPADLEAYADESALAQMDDSTGDRKFRDLLRSLVEQVETFYDVSLEVRDAFEIATAEGVQLDTIGKIVGLPRQGFNDSRYRTLLEIQTELLLAQARTDSNWTGTSENILRIARKFVGVTSNPIALVNLPPYDFEISVPDLVDFDEANLLAGFIRKAIYAAVLGHMTVVFDETSRWGDVTATVVQEGDWGDVTASVTDEASWAGVVVI